ncbi:MAG TPA: hypothetical protein GXX40_09565 [Firmicutes bacterium]|nr:hypothetical protein [Bacillota bacterium]
MKLVLELEQKANSLILVLVALIAVGAAALGYSAYRRNTISAQLQNLAIEVRALQRSLEALEQSRAHSSKLPLLAGAHWEKDLTEDMNAVAEESGTRLAKLVYTVQPPAQPSKKEAQLTVVAVEAELYGSHTSLLRAVSLVQEQIKAFKLDTVETMPIQIENKPVDQLKITGRLYCYTGSNGAGSDTK